MQYKTQKDVLETDGIAVFQYSLNRRAINMFEVGAFFLLIIAALIYPVTHFEPRQWMAAPIVLAVLAVAAFFTAQKWRHFVQNEFVAWDADNFYVTQGRKGVAVIPWKVLTLDNTGLKDPNAGAILNILIGPNEPLVQLRLASGFIIIEKFQNVLATILTHIKENIEREKKN